MKNIIKVLLVTVPVLILHGACTNNNPGKVYSDAIMFDYSDFPIIQKLEGNTFEMDTTILMPQQLHVYDSLLAVITRKEKHVLHLFDLMTGKEIASGITIGQGPKELLLPNFVDNADGSLLFSDQMSSSVVEYKFDKFIHNQEVDLIKRIALKKGIFGNVGILGDKFIAPAFQDKFLFNVYNTDGYLIDSIGVYPDPEIRATPMEKIQMFNFQFTTNTHDRIAVCYNWTDLIDIYDGEGKLLKRMHGPDHFISLFNERNNGNMTGALRVKDQNWDAYFLPVCVNNEIWVIYSGAKGLEKDFSDYRKRIFVFDWDGTPLRILELDRGIICFDVDEQNKKIYAVCPKPEFHIVEYVY